MSCVVFEYTYRNMLRINIVVKGRVVWMYMYFVLEFKMSVIYCSVMLDGVVWISDLVGSRGYIIILKVVGFLYKY